MYMTQTVCSYRMLPIFVAVQGGRIESAHTQYTIHNMQFTQYTIMQYTIQNMQYACLQSMPTIHAEYSLLLHGELKLAKIDEYSY